MSSLTRDATAEPASQEKNLRRERGQGNIHFPCSAEHEQDRQPVACCSCISASIGSGVIFEVFHIIYDLQTPLSEIIITMNPTYAKIIIHRVWENSLIFIHFYDLTTIFQNSESKYIVYLYSDCLLFLLLAFVGVPA